MAVTWAEEHLQGVLQAWYPGAQGGKAVAEVLFGTKNPEGKLPITFYKTSEELPAFTDYNMKGRTYRYMKQDPLYPFGYGLSYTNYTYSNFTLSNDHVTEAGITAKVQVTNSGEREGRETVQVYVGLQADWAPNAQLKGIKKVALQPGETKEVEILLPQAAFELCDEEGVRKVFEGEYMVSIGGGQPTKRTEELTGGKTLTATVRG